MANLQLPNQVLKLPTDIGLLIMDLDGTIISHKREPIRGVKRFLAHHKNKGVPIVISSATPEKGIVHTLEKLRLSPFFKKIYGSEYMSDEVSKDISGICNEQGVAPERALMVGDWPGIDGESARRAGVKYLAVPPMQDFDPSFTYDQFLRMEN